MFTDVNKIIVLWEIMWVYYKKSKNTMFWFIFSCCSSFSHIINSIIIRIGWKSLLIEHYHQLTEIPS